MFKLNKAFTPLKIARCPVWKFIQDFTERPVWVGLVSTSLAKNKKSTCCFGYKSPTNKHF
jgi:hypothetical protein